MHTRITRLDNAIVNLVPVTIRAQASIEFVFVQAQRSGESTQILVIKCAGILPVLV